MVVRITEMMQLVSLEKVIRPHTPLVFLPFHPYTVEPLFKGHKICLVTENIHVIFVQSVTTDNTLLDLLNSSYPTKAES